MASFPDDLLDEHEGRAVRLVALALLDDAAAQRERLSQPDDPDALHDFRVAVRRLRSWLRAQGEVLGDSSPKRAQRWLRRLARATNQSRDAEVLAGWLEGERTRLTSRQRVGAAWLLQRLAQQKAAADVEVLAEVARDFERARELLEARLPRYRLRMHVHDGAQVTSFAGAMAAQLRTQLSRWHRRLELVHGPQDAEAVHRARIAGKRLRYLLEPIVPHVEGGAQVLERLKALQDALGDFHDAHVWQQVMADALERAAREEAKALVAPAVPGEGAPVVPSRKRSPRPGVVAMIGHVQERAREVFQVVQRDWTGAALAPLVEGVNAIADALDARARSGVEIERKYLLDSLPELPPGAQVKEIMQGYLPGRRLVERLRRVREGEGERYYRTMKLGSGVARTEVEEECGAELFETLWPLTEGRRVTKRRYVVDDGALTWEIDEFTDRDLVLAEVELPSAEVVPDLPSWLAPAVVREVTGEAEYVNANLAR